MTPADFGCSPWKDISVFHRKGQPVVMLNLARPANHPYHRGVSTQDFRVRYNGKGEATKKMSVRVLVEE